MINRIYKITEVSQSNKQIKRDMKTEKIIEEFRERFPHKIYEVIDDFGSTTKSDIESFIKSSQENLIKEIIEEIIELRNKKFPIGERQWCVECANRFYKEIINKLKET